MSVCNVYNFTLSYSTLDLIFALKKKNNTAFRSGDLLNDGSLCKFLLLRRIRIERRRSLVEGLN